MQNSYSWAFKADEVETWAYFNKAFTKEECQKIIEIGEKLENKFGGILNEDKKLPNVRNSYIGWIMSNPENSWIFQRLTEIVLDLNAKYFKFNIYGFLEGLQFTKYTEPDGCYKQHIDKTLYGRIRKLSITIQLSEQESYKGGDLCLYISEEQIKANKEIGALTIFPSYTLHEVLPVTKGTRYSLVGWITGENFK